MKDLILKIYELLAVMLPFIIVFAIIYYKKKRLGSKSAKGHNILVFVFAFYIFGVFFYTGTGTLYDILRMGIEIREEQINLTPFSNTINTVAYILNVLLFVPLGFLLPLVWAKTDRVLTIIVSGFSLSLLIEMFQLLNNRATDVDDLIMNVLGAVLGYLLFKLFVRLSKWGCKSLDDSNWEPLLYICVMLAGRFILFNEFGMAKILYGF